MRPTCSFQIGGILKSPPARVIQTRGKMSLGAARRVGQDVIALQCPFQRLRVKMDVSAPQHFLFEMA